MARLKQNIIVFGLILLGVLEVFSLSSTMPIESRGGVVDTNISELKQTGGTTSLIPRLSEIQDSRIDEAGATIVAEPSVLACFVLPLSIWVFLLAAYAALLIFNFSYTFERATKPQWAWETVLTVLVLVAWYVWDECSFYGWFPFAVVKLGLIIALLYAYLLERKMSEKNKEREASL